MPAESNIPANDSPAHPIYLDNAATTPLRPQAKEAMLAALDRLSGNPSSAHELGRNAKAALEEARCILAECLAVGPDELYFTSGATESNNLAIRGICDAREANLGVVTSTLEHASVTKAIRDVKRKGRPVSYIGAKGGLFDFEAYREALAKPLALVSVMAVQNEVGYRFPIEDIAQAAHDANKNIVVHSDCTQAFGKVPLSIAGCGLDLATISSHKIGGPTGVGALYVKRGTNIHSNALGGGQERGLRSGTEPVWAIVGFAAAARAAMEEQRTAESNARTLWHMLADGLCALDSRIVINSREDGSPFIVSFTLPDAADAGNGGKRGRGEVALTKMGLAASRGKSADEDIENGSVDASGGGLLEFLSKRGIYISRASACSENHLAIPQGTRRPKHSQPLILAGVPARLIDSTFRVSFSSTTTKADVAALLAAMAAWQQQQEERAQ